MFKKIKTLTPEENQAAFEAARASLEQLQTRKDSLVTERENLEVRAEQLHAGLQKAIRARQPVAALRDERAKTLKRLAELTGEEIPLLTDALNDARYNLVEAEMPVLGARYLVLCEQVRSEVEGITADIYALTKRLVQLHKLQAEQIRIQLKAQEHLPQGVESYLRLDSLQLLEKADALLGLIEFKMPNLLTGQGVPSSYLRGKHAQEEWET